jgi:isopenicillin-N epimerase
MAGHWTLDPEVVYLNHGSFGACPREVLDAQSALRSRLEREPVRFFIEALDPLMDRSREAAAGFVHANPRDIVPVPNATTGVTTAAASVPLRPGDEILVNDHEYPACLNNLRRLAASSGARVVTASLPFPVRSPDEVFDAIIGSTTPRTRLCLVSHITSPSAMILPVEGIVRELEPRGIAVLVDGAHAPGQIDVNLDALGASFYTANFHKWPCAPKGAAMLWVREDRQAGFRPLVLSNNAEKPKPGRSQFHTEFDYVGTDDPTAWLSVPDAIRAVGNLGRGWDAVLRHNHALALAARDLLCKAVGAAPSVPDSMLGSMATIVLPAGGQASSAGGADPLKDALLTRHRIQVPVWTAGGRRSLRISAQLYNSRAQYEHLAAALVEELRREGSL